MDAGGANDFVLAIVLLGVGAVLVLWGGAALRVLIALAGAFVGFFLGAELVQDQAGGELLGTFWGWVAAIVGALVLGILAYLWYWLGVVLWVAAMGYVLGVFLANAFGADEDWVLMTVGLAVAAVLVVIAVIARLPAMLLIVVSAWAGASLVVTGAMLLFGEIDSEQVDRAFTVADPAWLWYGAVAVIFIVGLIVQLGATSRRSPQNIGG
ncbi:DUF4203 domain-containing protein [Mumia qirimensis]|uniref:TM7S3/TM198-like domain-containing protein n=1 Tax=Mumia qirimensis TaxID=3234852 RepID=UPI00351D860B